MSEQFLRCTASRTSGEVVEFLVESQRFEGLRRALVEHGIILRKDFPTPVLSTTLEVERLLRQTFPPWRPR